MTTIELVGRALVNMGVAEPLPCESTEAVCCITGEHGMCIPRKLLIGESFTTQGVFKAPDSEFVGENAWYAFKHRPERAGNWYCNGVRFMPMDRKETRARLLGGFVSQSLPWAMYVTTSFKKHGSLVAPLNQPCAFAVGFETEIAACSPELVDVFNSDLLYWQGSGIVRSDLQTGHIMATRQADTRAVCHFDVNVQGRRHLPLYRMLAYLLPGKDAEEAPNDVD